MSTPARKVMMCAFGARQCLQVLQPCLCEPLHPFVHAGHKPIVDAARCVCECPSKQFSFFDLLQRLMRDFKRLRNDPPQGINGSPNPDNIMHWNAVIFGPEDTPWDGGVHPEHKSHPATARRFQSLPHVNGNL